MKPYTLEEQQAAERELGLILSLSEGRGACRLCTMLDDFLLMRDQCR